MSIIGRIYFLICWSAAIFILISAPMREHGGDRISYYDKIAHIILFGILAYLIVYAFITYATTISRYQTLFLTSFFASIFYAYGCEYIQKFVPGRDASLYDLIAGIVGITIGLYIAHRSMPLKKPKLLLHICCAGCGAYVSSILNKDYQVILYFYNPSIFPQDEYKKRLEDTKRVAKKYNWDLIVDTYNHSNWLNRVRNLEHEPERGKRCTVCYQDRLERTKSVAQRNKIGFFTTTLTVSPHKDATRIINLGTSMANQAKIVFLNQDFKKKNGFQKASLFSKKLNLYRQDYCGCEFSVRNNKKNNIN